MISSVGTSDPLIMLPSSPPPAPATASSAGASSPTIPANMGLLDRLSHGNVSKAASLSTSSGGSALGSSRLSCRPWERGDLLRRLATFKPSNWLGKPKVVSSLACAQRGWMNVDADKIECETCGSSLNFPLSSSIGPVEVDVASEAFAKQLDAGHKTNCPWRGNSCPESLVQFPPTPQPALIGGFKDRCDCLLQFQSLPVVAASAIDQMRVSRAPQVEHFLSQLQNFMASDLEFKSESVPELATSYDEAFYLYCRAQKLISLCGWEPRWLLNAQDCEEHSAQSARNGCSFVPKQAQFHPSENHGLSKIAVSTSARGDTGKNKLSVIQSRCESRSPLLDCSLCGATVRIWDFLTVARPSRYAPNVTTGKKMVLTRGASAASGISGWVANDDMAKEQVEDRDEVTTTDEGKPRLANTDVDLNLTMAGGLTVTQMERTQVFGNNTHDVYMGRDLMIGQPAGSEVGDRAASIESRGPSSRKRSFEKGASSADRPRLRTDSIEGTVVDRDGDEVTDSKQYSAGPSKRARETDIFDTASAGPIQSPGLCIFGSARDSARASSVIARDTVCGSDNEDSMESVENHPGDVDDDAFRPSSSVYGNLDLNDTSELAQQSTCFQVPGEIGGSSNVDDEEILNVNTTTNHLRGGFSFGISGGSVGMCASHEAEIHGTEISIHRTGSVVGDVEPRMEDVENQWQTGESAPEGGTTREGDLRGDSQEMFSRSVGREDSGSKIDGSMKGESVESGEKEMRKSHKLGHENGACRPSLSCNAVADSENETKEVIGADKVLPISDGAYLGNGIGPPKGESNYEEALEFDPIVHHNQFCPWVNGNVAAAGCSSSIFSEVAEAVALSGWQLTLDALDALRSEGKLLIQTVQSESAASLYKDDHQTPTRKLVGQHSVSNNRGPHI